MVEVLLLIGVLVAMFVGYNIGGSTTGPAFGPAVGAGAVSKSTAAALMATFFFIGAWTIGRRVVDTLGTELVSNPGVFTLETSIGVLFFIGVALFVGNVFGVPASTSMTAVGAIAGLGVAKGALDWQVMGGIVIWWLVAPVIGFWVSLIIGRYFYDRLDRAVNLDSSEGAVLEVTRGDGVRSAVTIHDDSSRREAVGVAAVVLIGCLMAFSSGTSNIANAIAPLVGSGALAMNPGIAIGGVAVAIGSFTIARRTLETMGSDITELPLTAAIVVATVSAVLVVFLSFIGIPASFVVIATMSIVGLGWGRATRPIAVSTAVGGDDDATSPVAGDGLVTDGDGEDTADTADTEDIPSPSDLFDPETTARVVVMQNVVPVISTVGAFLTFRYAPFF